MPTKRLNKLLIANRGEIAIRIARAAAELNIPCCGIYAEDDRASAPRHIVEQLGALDEAGPSAYLNGQKIIELAKSLGCDALHPGYGFLSENAGFAQACLDNHIRFIGPRPELLTLFGDKASAREHASRCDIPVLPGKAVDNSEEACEFFERLNGRGMLLKAVAGGGGRGMRIIQSVAEIKDAFSRAQSEAQNAFGNNALYAEALLDKPRHIEVQIIADQHGHIIHLGERDCTIQRRHQKLIEVAPAPTLSDHTRQRLLDAAMIMASACQYDHIGTFEFLLAADGEEFFFIETNPRLQVEHTVTEAVTQVDIVQTQLQIAAGLSLPEIGLGNTISPHGTAIQLRINAESIDQRGQVKPSHGELQQYALPTGPGVRVDSHIYPGYVTNPRFDTLLAKIISQANTFKQSINKSGQLLNEIKLEGLASNCLLLKNILALAEDPRHWHTRWVDQHIDKLGEKISASAATVTGDDQQITMVSPLQGTVVKIIDTAVDIVQGDEIVVIESMKMEHVVLAPCNASVEKIYVRPGDTLAEEQPLLLLNRGENSAHAQRAEATVDLDFIRQDLAEVQQRHQFNTDAARPEAVARRRKTTQRTARENIADIIDENSFAEYGGLAIASQRARRSLEELIAKSPADGMIAGTATVNGDLFPYEQARCVVMSYDYTVFAGTQGQKNHRKKDRMFELALQWQLPVILFAEGGGGRPGETERTGVSGLDCLAFYYFAKLKGLVPLIAIVSGRCFAGNAVLAGCSDVIIATGNTNLGMAGPAMIEGGGLGVFKPEDIGPTAVQTSNGVIDIAVEDEAQAVQIAKKYLSYTQGDLTDWHCDDQRKLRHIIPENRLRVYDIRELISTLTDTNSVLELRKDFAHGMITAFARIEGKAIGIVANNPMHLGGAIDSEGADKAARFIYQCDSYQIPILFLCDTPGIMVGPQAEATALVRHASRLFIAGAHISVPFFCIVLRKAYGLGAQTMAGGTLKAPFFTVAWPTGEFGGMGLEGAVRLGYRDEIAAIKDAEERQSFFEEKVKTMYDIGKATSVASYLEIDDVIDPADTRRWLAQGLLQTGSQNQKTKRFLDTW